MSEKTPDLNQEIQESIEKLTNKNLAYALALYLNHKYDFGGYSVGRSERSFLLDLFFRLNREEGDVVKNNNPFDNGELFLNEISKRLEQIQENKKQNLLNLEIDINDKKIFSAIILKLWINHYNEAIQKNSNMKSTTQKDFSFESEVKRAQALYDLYLSDLAINENTLENESLKYIENTDQVYTNQLRWHVDDLCDNEDKF